LIDTIITEAIIHTILSEEGGGSVADRLDCDCLVLVAAPVNNDDAGEVLRSRDASNFDSEQEPSKSEVSSGPVKGSQLLAVSDLLTASNLRVASPW
jgi:hypothetical protein